MIDWILSLFEPKEEKDWTYDRAKIPLRSLEECCGRSDKIMYSARIRYTDDEIQIHAGRPKQLHWQTVKSDNLKFIIKQQL